MMQVQRNERPPHDATLWKCATGFKWLRRVTTVMKAHARVLEVRYRLRFANHEWQILATLFCQAKSFVVLRRVGDDVIFVVRDRDPLTDWQVPQELAPLPYLWSREVYRLACL